MSDMEALKLTETERLYHLQDSAAVWADIQSTLTSIHFPYWTVGEPIENPHMHKMQHANSTQEEPS